MRDGLSKKKEKNLNSSYFFGHHEIFDFPAAIFALPRDQEQKIPEILNLWFHQVLALLASKRGLHLLVGTRVRSSLGKTFPTN
ncbi:MAG: hypothetical protein ACFFAS_07685 [Promethearchaeota archaeon]